MKDRNDIKKLDEKRTEVKLITKAGFRWTAYLNNQEKRIIHKAWIMWTNKGVNSMIKTNGGKDFVLASQLAMAIGIGGPNDDIDSRDDDEEVMDTQE